MSFGAHGYSLLLHIYLGVELQAHEGYISSTLVDRAKVFFKVNVLIYTPTSNV